MYVADEQQRTLRERRTLWGLGGLARTVAEHEPDEGWRLDPASWKQQSLLWKQACPASAELLVLRILAMTR
jgi:hypothetical protein